MKTTGTTLHNVENNEVNYGLIAGNTNVHKSAQSSVDKAYPIGTIRDRADGKWKKTNQGWTKLKDEGKTSSDTDTPKMEEAGSKYEDLSQEEYDEKFEAKVKELSDRFKNDPEFRQKEMEVLGIEEDMVGEDEDIDALYEDRLIHSTLDDLDVDYMTDSDDNTMDNLYADAIRNSEAGYMSIVGGIDDDLDDDEYEVEFERLLSENVERFKNDPDFRQEQIEVFSLEDSDSFDSDDDDINKSDDVSDDDLLSYMKS